MMGRCKMVYRCILANWHKCTKRPCTTTVHWYFNVKLFVSVCMILRLFQLWCLMMIFWQIIPTKLWYESQWVRLSWLDCPGCKFSQQQNTCLQSRSSLLLFVCLKTNISLWELGKHTLHFALKTGAALKSQHAGIDADPSICFHTGASQYNRLWVGCFL